jgi:hypothetical protein
MTEHKTFQLGVPIIIEGTPPGPKRGRPPKKKRMTKAQRRAERKRSRVPLTSDIAFSKPRT